VTGKKTEVAGKKATADSKSASRPCKWFCSTEWCVHIHFYMSIYISVLLQYVSTNAYATQQFLFGNVFIHTYMYTHISIYTGRGPYRISYCGSSWTNGTSDIAASSKSCTALGFVVGYITIHIHPSYEFTLPIPLVSLEQCALRGEDARKARQRVPAPSAPRRL
jgi:hypothetical protein